MSYKEIIKIFEGRRDRMKNLLLDNSDTMAIDKQHQVFGAITEIEVFLQTLRNYCDKQNEECGSEPLNFYNNKSNK